MKRLLPLFLLLALLLPGVVPAQGFTGSTPAPEFPQGLDWLNTDEPLTLEGLRGRIVLLDFWTYGCINCVHVLPDLAALQEKYAEELVVIGVHSAKFTNEAQTENIQLIAERYGRQEPIVNDAGFDIWRAYGMNAWPGFILIDPEGNILGRHAGEGIYDLFDSVISSMIEVFDARGTLQREPAVFSSGTVVRPRAALRFPGKVLADAASDRLFIADSGNNRIVVTDLSGEVQAVIGSGLAELRDGGFAEAGFNAPQGMTLDEAGNLYVADTGNHSLRLIDLEGGLVTTVAGHGSQEYMFGKTEVDGLVHGLNSPWDVLWHDGAVYVAMAGQHQVWRYQPETSQLELFAGSGREQLLDGPLQAAGLNQPSGLAVGGQYLYIADSEASAIRQAELGQQNGMLMTVVGTGLFDFGDVDGTGDEVRLQHALGVEWADGLLYLADTYNHRIKLLDPATATVTTVAGSGEAAHADGSGLESSFFEPGGLSLLPGLLFVADTNNHAVRLVVLETMQVGTLTLSDPDGLLLAVSAGRQQFDEELVLEPVSVAEGSVQVSLTLSLPEGYVANHLAPLQVEWSLTGAGVATVQGSTQRLNAPEYPLTLTLPLELELEAGAANVTADVAIYYCQDSARQLCLIRQVRLQQPLQVQADSMASTVHVAWQPPPLP